MGKSKPRLWQSGSSGGKDQQVVLGPVVTVGSCDDWRLSAGVDAQ